jgi:hypothetical protein
MNEETMAYNIKQYEYTMTDILGHSWEIFCQQWKPLLAIFLTFILVYNVCISLITIWFNPQWQAIAQPPFNFSAMLHVFLNMMLYAMLAGLIFVLGVIAINKITALAAANQEIRLKDIYSFSFRKFFPYLGTSIITMIFLIVLFILLIVPGIIFAVFWSFALFTVVLKDKFGIHALKESKAVVQGRWWEIVGMMIVFVLIIAVVQLPINLVFAFTPTSSFLFVFLHNLLSSIVNVFFYVLLTIWFINYDMFRKSGVVSTKASPIPTTTASVAQQRTTQTIKPSAKKKPIQKKAQKGK